jgi:hypothetical protein
MAETFNFTDKEPGWSFYGEGQGEYVKNQGAFDKESLWMSTDWGDSETAFFEFKNLTPGNYQVSFYVRAQDVAQGPEGTSFWNFYDGGEGTISPFTDLYGNYEWKKVEYNVKVKNSSLTMWFRLKTPGQIWVDQFNIDKTTVSSDKIEIQNSKELIHAPQNTITQNAITQKLKLFNFEENDSGSNDFSIRKDKLSGGTGTFDAYKYYNLSVSDWRKFDRIELDVFNPNDEFAEFFVTLADVRTTNYWSQLNHKQNLAPGWNHLSLSLTQYLGERGSHRFLRSLDLSALKKFFIIVDPDKKKEYKNRTFFIDNIYITSNPLPVPPSGIMAFDFTSIKARPSPFIPVTSQMLYNSNRGFGFKDPKFFRVQDAVFSSELMRYSIGLHEGKFLLKVPNGKYHFQLVLDQLGYWDVPFWADRTLLVNGKPVFKESRSSGSDFLADLLQFEEVNIEDKAHPYDLYLKKIFKKIDRIVDVTNGFIEYEFFGDATGINLNSLVVWNIKEEKSAKDFLDKVEARNKLEFDWTSRPINSNRNQVPSRNMEFTVGTISPSLTLNPFSTQKNLSNELKFFAGTQETSYQVVQVVVPDDASKLSWSVSELANIKGEKIQKNEIEFNEIKYQFTSPDLNHETYLIAGKYIRPLVDSSIVVTKAKTIYLWLKLKPNAETIKGIFSGTISFNLKDKTIKLPVTISILNYQLPKVDFPVGFFGVDPLPYSYFKHSSYKALRKKFRYEAILNLNDSGFTTFTGLPEVEIKNNAGNLEVDSSEIDELFKFTSKLNNFKTVYSYSGQFPQYLLDLGNRPSGFTDDEYGLKTSVILKNLLEKKYWPKIVHTFSDEASGYSDQVNADIIKAKNLKKYYPFLALGGFGAFTGKESKILNSFFEYGFYSALSKSDISQLKENNLNWGFYGSSAGNLDDPRFSFGLGLYLARANGLSHYLEWNLGAVHNYPYFDFDGREADAIMFYPSRDGKLYNSIRYELATEGIQTYRKLKLLEGLILNQTGSPQVLKDAKAWLVGLAREHFFFSNPRFLSDKSVKFSEIQQKLNMYLELLCK